VVHHGAQLLLSMSLVPGVHLPLHPSLRQNSSEGPASSLEGAQLLLDRLWLTPTPSTIANMARMFVAAANGQPLLLVGPPGIGKTAIAQQVMLLVLGCTYVQEMVGGWHSVQATACQILSYCCG
jgi:Cdc6-like AAA superfamily ATPase